MACGQSFVASEQILCLRVGGLLFCQEFRADETGSRHRTILLFAALQFLDTLSETLDKECLPETLAALPNIERLVPALLQVRVAAAMGVL